MSPDDQAPKIHIDSDWKAEAQAEKERLSEEEKKQADAKGPAGGGPHQLPEANFRTLVSVLASQALMGLGTVQDPEGKGVMIDLDGSRLSIDLLGVLEEKTRGNLTDDENRELTHLLSELRARFVQVTKLVAQQASAASSESATPDEPALQTP